MNAATSFRPRLQRIVLPLALAEVLIWASVFYAFPALLLHWERDTGWSKTELTGAFSLALAASAVFAPVVGRLIDRGYARGVFSGATVAASVLLALLSQVDVLWQFYAVWVGLGVTMAGALYEPCFAIITRALGADARRGIAALTLIAGFAGTLSFPLFNALANSLGWRGALVIAAVLLLLVAPVLVWRAAGSAELLVDANTPAQRPPRGELGRVVRSAAFWLLGLSFAMIALTHGVLLTHILPLLDERGVHPETAVLAAAMIGPMQVLGRLAMVAVEGHVATYTVAQISFIAMGFSALSLFGLAASPLLLAVFVAVHGAAYGVTSITRPVVIAEFLGQGNYGVIAGLLATLYLLVVAVSPSLASLLWQIAGYDAVIALAFVATLCGLLCLLAAAAVVRRSAC